MISRSNVGCTFDINTRNTMGPEWDSTIFLNLKLAGNTAELDYRDVNNPVPSDGTVHCNRRRTNSSSVHIDRR